MYLFWSGPGGITGAGRLSIKGDEFLKENQLFSDGKHNNRFVCLCLKLNNQPLLERHPFFQRHENIIINAYLIGSVKLHNTNSI